jgi:hypothetical protein
VDWNKRLRFSRLFGTAEQGVLWLKTALGAKTLEPFRAMATLRA